MRIAGPPGVRTTPDRATRLACLFWLAVLVAHVLASAAWFWLEPGGFPYGHTRFWMNRVLPFAAAAWCLVSLVALHRGKDDRLITVLPAYPAAWASGAVAGRMIFPVTLAQLWLAPIVLALLMTLAQVPVRRGSRRGHGRRLAVVTGVWALLGAGVALSQRPQPPATHPLDRNLASEHHETRARAGPSRESSTSRLARRSTPPRARSRRGPRA